MNKKRILFRIVAFIPTICIIAIGMIGLFCKLVKDYVLYGSEMIVMQDKNERKTIADIYYLLKKQNNDKVN